MISRFFKSDHYYSVRQSQRYRDKYKVVIANGINSYEDVDLPLYETFELALEIADKLNKSKSYSKTPL